MKEVLFWFLVFVLLAFDPILIPPPLSIPGGHNAAKVAALGRTIVNKAD